MKTKIFTLLFAIVVGVVTIFASDTQVDGIWYDFDDISSTASVTHRGSSNDPDDNEYRGSIIIPSSVVYNGVTYSVTSIGNYAFGYCVGLTNITIPNSVTSIGEWAFSYCYSLTSIAIPNSVTNIGNHAFYECTSLTSIEIPNSVTSIGYMAFAKCIGLTSLPIPNSVTSIGDGAFYNCIGLKSVTIPNYITSIESDAFSCCYGLTSVTIPNSVTSIAIDAFEECSNIASVTWNAKNCNGCNFGGQVESFVFGDEVEVIPSSICSRMTKLTSITIPNSVTSIGSSAFDGCTSLTTVTIGNSVTSIGDGAFSNCDSLESVTIPNSVISIGDHAFSSCRSLTAVTIPNSVTGIGSSAFSNCDSLESVTIPNSVISIGDHAFHNCSSLTSVTIPNSVTSIGDGAFWNCVGLTSITIPNSVTSIGSFAFSSCYGLTSITIPSSVTRIEECTFYKCHGLKSVVIPNSVTSIGSFAFSHCSLEKNIILPEAIDSIGVGAFEYNVMWQKDEQGYMVLRDDKGKIQYTIKSITCLRLAPPAIIRMEGQSSFFICDGSFLNYEFPYSSVVLYVYAGSVNVYKLRDMWGEFDIRPLVATETETTETQVTPTNNAADIVWPVVDGAASYELIIKDKDGNVVCTLIFNANGQLTSIAFNAPSSNGAPRQAQSAGFAFTVTGLEEGSTYQYSMTAKDGNGNVLSTASGTFTTTGGSQSLTNVQSDDVQCTKVIRDGQMFILRGDKTYTADGQLVH